MTVSAAATLLICVASASAQTGGAVNLPGPRATAAGAGGAASATGVNSNVNTLSTGSNRNTNANSNSQFMSGSNTGVNNGALEIYAGADPYQGIVVEGSANLPQLPGFVQSPSNFSQPYKPETFVNGPTFLPAEMTLAEAKSCRDSKGSWHGGSLDKVTTIRLFYSAKRETPQIQLTMANYVGTAMATASDRPFIAALCEAAYRAMNKGASVGVVDFGIRPKNTMFGLGFGASGGATGLPAAGANPYAIAGTLGFGTGWSSQRVEGEVVLQLTALRGSPQASSSSSGATSPPAEPAIPDGPHGQDPGPREVTHPHDAPVAGSIQLAAVQDTATIGDNATPPWRDAGGGRAAPSKSQRLSSNPVTHHSPKKLVTLRTGQSKDRVFDLFGAMFVDQNGRIVEVEGMRLIVSGRAARNRLVEVSEVTLAESDALETRYWFLFEDRRLTAWGRAEEWDAAATRHGLDLPYHSGAPPSSLKPWAGLAPGR